MFLELVMTQTMEDTLVVTEPQLKSSKLVYTGLHYSKIPKTWSKSATNVKEHEIFLRGIRCRRTPCWRWNCLIC